MTVLQDAHSSDTLRRGASALILCNQDPSSLTTPPHSPVTEQVCLEKDRVKQVWPSSQGRRTKAVPGDSPASDIRGLAGLRGTRHKAASLRALGPQSLPGITVFVAAGSEMGLIHQSWVTRMVDLFSLVSLNQHCPQQKKEGGSDFLRN